MDVLNNKEAERPDLILLDINLPKVDGKDVLKHIKSDKELAEIPTVMLTSSTSDVELAESYRLKADGYIHKPDRLNEYDDMVRSIEEIWFDRMYYSGSTGKRKISHMPFVHTINEDELTIFVRRYQLTTNVVDECLSSIFSIYNDDLLKVATKVTLNLEEVEFVDFSGVNFIAAIKRLFEGRGCDFELSGISPVVLETLFKEAEEQNDNELEPAKGGRLVFKGAEEVI